MLRHQLTTTQKVKYEIVGNETFPTMFTKNNCVNIVDGTLEDRDIVYYKEDGILYCFSIIELLKNPTENNKYTGKPFGDSLMYFLSTLQIPTFKKKEIVKVVKEKVPSLLDDLYDDLKQLEGSVTNEEYKKMFITNEDDLTTSIWKVEDDFPKEDEESNNSSNDSSIDIPDEDEPPTEDESDEDELPDEDEPDEDDSDEDEPDEDDSDEDEPDEDEPDEDESDEDEPVEDESDEDEPPVEDESDEDEEYTSSDTSNDTSEPSSGSA
jgi:hypothetical protein